MTEPLPKIKQNVDDICDGKNVKNCVAIERITKMLQFYSNTNYDNFHAINDCLESYKFFLRDHHHILDKHLNEDSVPTFHSDEQFNMIYTQIQNNIVCDVERCKIYSRNNRARETVNIKCNDEHLSMLIDLFDAIHCYYLHSIDMGYRNVPQFNSASEMLELQSYLSSKRKTLESIRGQQRLFNNKFTTHIIIKIIDKVPTETKQCDSDPVNEQKQAIVDLKDQLSMEGYLQKESLHLKQFRKRFIVLKDNYLYCYKTHKNDTNATEIIDLVSYKHAILSQKNVGQFLLIPASKKSSKRAFSADSLDEAQQWMNVINQSIKYTINPYSVVTDSKQESIQNTMDENVFCFGERRDYWKYFKKGKYNSIKNEVVSNKIYSVTIKQFNKALKKAKYLTSRSTNIKKLKCCYAAHNQYGMTRYAPPSPQNILSVILYTDYDSLQYKFSETFRKIFVDESQQLLKNRGNEFWNWSKTLIETVNAFGTMVKDSNISVFYHGISSPIYFPSLIPTFNSPTSTTPKLSIACQFAKAGGIIVELAKMENWCHDVKYFNCTFVSCFGNEEERLFIQPHDPNHHLQLLSIRNMSTNENYKQFVYAINIFQRITEADKYKKMEEWESVEGKTDDCINDLILMLHGQNNVNCPNYIHKMLHKWANSMTTVHMDLIVVKKHTPKISLYNPKDEDVINVDKINTCFKRVQTISLGNVMWWTVTYWNKIASMLEKINNLQYSKLTKIMIQQINDKTMEWYCFDFDKFQKICENVGWMLAKDSNEEKYILSKTQFYD
eukprot:38111_1